MKKTIYAVNAGEYSDYRIIALFSTMEKARDYMEATPQGASGFYNDVEEYELDPDAADLIRRGYSVWSVTMTRDGNTESVKAVDLNASGISDLSSWIWRRSKAPAYKDKGLPDCIVSKVMAKSPAGAVKIVNEQRTRMVASGEWDRPQQ